MRSYYFSATALPELSLSQPPDMSFHECCQLFRLNLSEEDYEKIRVIRLFYDLQNVRSFWRKKPLDTRGNYTAQELEEALLTRSGLPEYIFDFLAQYESVQERIDHFPALLAQYFFKEQERAEGFLHTFLHWEREWRLLFAGLRAKEGARDLVKELQFEDPGDPLVAILVAQKDAEHLVLPSEYQGLQEMYEQHCTRPLELQKALSEWRFYRIEDLLGVDLFSIDRIVGYLVQLIVVEKWFALDQEKGKELVKNSIGERDE